MKTRWIVVAMLVGMAALGARSQGVMTVTGAPFTATWTVTTETAGKVETGTVFVARASNGSVYRKVTNDGSITEIEIDNVPRESRLLLQPLERTYGTETPPPHGKWITRTVEEQRAILERSSGDSTRKETDLTTVNTSLGVKTVDGMTLFGQHYVRTRGKERVMEGDNWQSDLGFTYSEQYAMLLMTSLYHAQNVVYSSKQNKTITLVEMKRGEPSPLLFKLPKGYSKMPDCMLNSAVPPTNNSPPVQERPCRPAPIQSGFSSIGAGFPTPQ